MSVQHCLFLMLHCAMLCYGVREDLSEKVHLGMSHQALEAQERILHGTVLGAALHPSLQCPLYYMEAWDWRVTMGCTGM